MPDRRLTWTLSGLMIARFVAVLSSTVVATSLPVIVTELDGRQSAYSWIAAATLITLAVSVPLWGKLADLFDRRLLVQIGLLIYAGASVGAGLAQTTEALIAARAVQGVGVGGITALTQIIIADLVSARERGRLNGHLGLVFAVATIMGPFVGGLLTDALGWRACFFVGIPFALVALVTLRSTLTLPAIERPDRAALDLWGAAGFAAAASLLLAWVSLAGFQFAWLSLESVALCASGTMLALLTAWWERRATDALFPVRVVRTRTVALAIAASALFGSLLLPTLLYLNQYLQIARGLSPTQAGALAVPMIVGLVLGSTVSGRRISRKGRYRGTLLVGAALLAASLGWLATMSAATSLHGIAAVLAVNGWGIGTVMQNLVVVTQNAAPKANIGAASGLVLFARSAGGAVGVTVLGAVLAGRLAVHGAGEQSLRALTEGRVAAPGAGIAPAVAPAYSAAIGDVFLVATAIALAGALVVALLPDLTLKGGAPAAQKSSHAAR